MLVVPITTMGMMMIMGNIRSLRQLIIFIECSIMTMLMATSISTMLWLEWSRTGLYQYAQ
jgi:type IV secretory pathway VirB2 component (pilin)